MTGTSRSIYLKLFLLFFVTFAYFYQGGGWNQNTRFCLTRSMIHHRTLSIDAYREDSTNPEYVFVNTGDWAYRNGRYYTNKSPGMSLAAIIPFGAAEAFFARLFPSDPEKQVLLSSYVSTVCTVSLFAALLCLLLFHVATDFFGLTRQQGLTAAVFFGMGTLCFAYSTAFYCHVPAGFFTFLSFVTAMHLKRGTIGSKRAGAALSGCCASIAVLIEPSALVIMICIGCYLATFQDGRYGLPFFLIGCVPAGVMQCAYNAICFGGPFASCFDYANEVVMDRINGKLLGMPYPFKFIEMFFLPYRGLFITSPVLLMAVPGLLLCLKKRAERREALFCALAAASLVVFISCFFGWQGGSTVGLRYVLAAVPFCFVLCIPAFERFPKLFWTIGAISVLINLSITTVGSEIPYSVQNPLVDVIFPNVLAGNVSINPVPVSNFQAYPSIYELADHKTWQNNFNSFNLGELVFPNSLASLLPLLLFWCGWWYVWRKEENISEVKA
jgi:hypothetical protein